MAGLIGPEEGRGAAHMHWPEVDGLRSVAVLPVLAFHFHRTIISGGFIGVDIFFVISGFLITSLLAREIDRDCFSLASFYQRRIARIAPAFILVLAVTLAASVLVYAGQDIASAGATAAFAAMSLANIKFMLQGNYFQVSPDAQPSLHYWSLSVEEQFYLLFPLFLYSLLRWSKRPLAVTFVLGAVSYATCIALTKLNPVWAFYLLPTRAFELLAGTAVALLLRNNGFRALGVWWWIPATGVFLIAVSLVIIAETSFFPGAVVLLPVLGTALVLISAGDGGFIGRLLSHPLPVFVGLRSYSLYLWHWPIYSFVDYQFFEANALMTGAAKIVLTITLALLTYEFVERPARRFFNQPRHRSFAFTAFILASTAIVAVGLQMRAMHYLDARPENVASGGVTINGGQRARIVLIGDSEGAMYGAELALIARSRGYTVHSLAMPGKTELPDLPGTYWPQVLQYLSQRPPDLVILIEAWTGRVEDGGTSLATALTQLHPLAPVILVTQPPQLPPQASREGIRNGARAPFFELNDQRTRRERANALLVGFAGERVRVVDVAPLFVDGDGAVQVLNHDGRMNFHDANHLSSFGTALVQPLLEREIEAALAASPRPSRQ